MSQATGRAHSPQTNHPNYHTGKQPGRKWDVKNDRLHLLWAPTVRPVWESADWWVAKANALPGRDCGKHIDHGPCRVRYSTTFAGRTLAYSCTPCGWEEVVLVQEGALEPCAPDRSGVLPKSAYQLQWARQDSTVRLKRAKKAAQARRESIKKHGIKRREWWEDDE